MIPKEDGSFKIRSKPKVNVQFCWIKTTASGLSYELGVNGQKKLMKTVILLIKTDIAYFTLVNLEILTV